MDGPAKARAAFCSFTAPSQILEGLRPKPVPKGDTMTLLSGHRKLSKKNVKKLFFCKAKGANSKQRFLTWRIDKDLKTSNLGIFSYLLGRS